MGSVPVTAPVARVLLLLVIVGGARPARADDPVAYGTRLPVPGIDGALVIAGEPARDEAITRTFLDLASGAGARLVVIGAAADANADAALWRERGVRRVTTVTAGRDVEGGPDAVAALRGATGVWLSGPPDGVLRCLAAPATRTALAGVMRRGGVVGAGGATAPVLAPVIVGDGADDRAGLGLLPGVMMGSVFLGARPSNDLLQAHRRNPARFGLGVDTATALVVRGRTGRVIGRSFARVTLAPSARRPEPIETVPPDGHVDLVTLSRAAVARAAPPFPPPRPRTPEVETGTLFLGGGGRVDLSVVRRFVTAAGGPQALIVVVPTAIGGPRQRAAGNRDATVLARAGARRVRVLDARTPADAEAPEARRLLAEAGGLWFTGGRQWRLVDAFLDTEAHELMHDVVRRGGAVYGASAGASIQAEYMVRGHPLGNRVMMAEGYERGLGFLPGVAVDQHFRQRGRGPDMERLKRAFPQLVGIGLDEGALIVVHGHVMEIVGRDGVSVYARAGAPPVVLAPGERYDLSTRRRTGPGR
jgi:cyanophycinase